MNRRVTIAVLGALTGLLAVAAWVYQRSPPEVDSRPSIAVAGSERIAAVSTSGESAVPQLSGHERAPSTFGAEVPHEQSQSTSATPQRAPANSGLKGLAADLEARANGNDARAAFELSRMHEACSIAQGFVGEEGLEVEALMMRMGFAPTVAQSVLQRFSDRADECSKWMSRDFDHFSAHLEMQKRASAIGHPVARALALGLKSENSSVTRDAEGDRRSAMISLLETGDPTWLADIGFYISTTNGAYRHEAYALAACQLQSRCAEDPLTFALERMSPDSAMGGLSYAYLLMLSRRDRQIAEAQAREIVEHWNARRFDRLVPKRP